ncbi:Polymorphic membrane protein F,chlamydial polymorphic outer membrane protein repeat,Autotransporter beta-domain [Chlamydia poikilotherma]|uniref:Polymorphic membrane protein F,chlamydial polymorphic outer membrane protein repeat,Autotransporter beta-domain n=1 Tax=Chlamydia poikilotherma TaxID=1967783 RepID=A0A3B0QFW8_9CHLA|nr:polymorphic outer membrane protein middle domain-containing protein [Chlamydia poikilotherma]SYX08762.1 Polymorphic membrane protein F,chlamydial polymorphic outer membrane protein repeat,Autotransporter beta-domain [Chlamydia poikilotherma]
MIFDGNSAAHAGGALSCQNLTIQDNGPTYFFNNTACWGGAFYGQTANGSTLLSADNGDIIFNNNITIARDGPSRSAMFFSSNHTLSLGATSNQRICFFDTIDTSNVTSFTINPEAKHTGAVVFSAAHVQPNLTTNLKSIQTSYNNELRIKHGIISVENGAQLSAYKITSEANTYLCLGNSAVVKTQQKSNSIKDSNLQIKNIGILLTEVLQPKAISPMLWIYPEGGGAGGYSPNSDAKISVSGSLTLWNEWYCDPYDSIDLSQPIDGIPLLHFSEPENNSITIDDFDIQSINSHQHYGHQGIWTPYWKEIKTPSITTSADTTNSKHRYLYANWLPTGYIVNPQHRGDLVANTLRQTAYKATAFYPSLIDNATPSFYLQGQGLGMHTHQKDKNAILGFSSRSLGYSGKCLLSSKTNHKFLLTFSQVIGKMKEHTSTNKISSHNYLVNLSLQIPWFNEHLITTASLGYCYGDHHMQSFYTQNKKSETQFEDHALSARISCYLYEKLSLLNHYFTPYIQLSGVRAEQTKINETGDFPRKFSNEHPLIDVTLPIGIQTSWAPKTHLPSFWEIQLAYQPSIYRQNPKILTTLLASNGSWISSGSSVTPHSLHAEVRNSIYLFHNIVAFLNYQLDLSSSTTSHYINAGSRVVF